MSKTVQLKLNKKHLCIALVIVVALLIVMMGALLRIIAADARRYATQDRVEEAAAYWQDIDAKGNATGGMSGVVGFDLETAQRLPADVTPEMWVTAYYEAIVAQDWQTAWEHLPADKQVAQTAAQLGEQLLEYGVTDWRLLDSEDANGVLVIQTKQMTEYGIFINGWTFVRADDDTWILRNKAVTGME